MVSQIHIFFTLFTLWCHCYTLRSTSSKIVSVMVSLNSYCCYTFYIMVSLLLTAFKYLKNCHHYGLTKYSHFTFTGYIMVSLCRTNQKVQKVAKRRNCIFLIRDYTFPLFCHLLQNYSKIKQKRRRCSNLSIISLCI